MAKTISAKMCEIVSDVAHLPLEKIQSVIGTQSCIDKYIYILHDKDVRDDGTPKNPHYHVYLHFTNARQFDYIAKWFGIPVSFVSRIHGRFGDAVSYAVHHNAPDKYQYSVSECISNFDISATIDDNDRHKENKKQLDDILSGIDSGEIMMYNITSKISLQMYVKYNKQIKMAFDYKRQQRRIEVDRNMHVYYIYGQSGLGKTTLAKMLCQKLGLVFFVSSSSNDPFDGYQDEPAIILDDLRGSVFTFTDLLKILDPHTASSVKARYKNIVLGCDSLFITSTIAPRNFYQSIFDSHGEEYKQFLRRLETVYYMTSADVAVYQYDSSISDLQFITCVSNPVAKIVRQQKLDVSKSKQVQDALLTFSENELAFLCENDNPLYDDFSEYELII